MALFRGRDIKLQVLFIILEQRPCKIAKSLSKVTKKNEKNVIEVKMDFVLTGRGQNM